MGRSNEKIYEFYIGKEELELKKLIYRIENDTKMEN